MTTYQPTGTGLCAECGRDVRWHDDPAHKFQPQVVAGVLVSTWTCAKPGCRCYKNNSIHDVGRVLRCV